MISLIKNTKTFVVFYNDTQYTVVWEKDGDEEYIDIIDDKGNYLDSKSILFDEIESYVDQNANIF